MNNTYNRNNSFLELLSLSPCFYCGAMSERAMVMDIDELTSAFGLPEYEDDMAIGVAICDCCIGVEGANRYTPKLRNLVMSALAENS